MGEVVVSSPITMPSPHSLRPRPSTVTFGALLASVGALVGCANDNPPGSVGGSGGAGSSTTTSSASTSSAAATSSVASSSATTSNASSASSTGSGPTCTDADPGEPNETIASAYALPDITDCNSDMPSLDAMLGENVGGTGDVDWYKYNGKDTLGFGCSVGKVHPTASVTGPVARVCTYIECTAAAFTCPSGTQNDVMGGKPGCCWNGSAEVTLDLNCNGTNDSATVYLRVDHPNGPGCEPYTLKYHY